MDYLKQLDERIESWWPLARAAREDFVPFDRPRLPGAISELDARSFLRGLDADPPLYRVDEGYKLFSVLLPRLASGAEKQWNLMERKGTSHINIRDETIVHYGVATELIFDFGWPIEQVVSEPRADGIITRGSVDLLLYRGGRPVIAVEAKGAPRLLGALVRGMNACVGTSGKGHAPTDHKKCLGLLLFRPELLWVVAAGPTRELFRIEYLANSVRLLPEEDETLIEAT